MRRIALLIALQIASLLLLVTSGVQNRGRAEPVSLQEPKVSSSRPTFDCAKARSITAEIICSGEDGARADWSLSASAWAYVAQLNDDARKAFWKTQDDWFSSLAQACGLSPQILGTQRQCVIEAYQRRAKSLQSKLSPDGTAEVMLSPEQRAIIQQNLNSLGYLNGDADGEFGPNTRQAIQRYKQSNGHGVSLYLTADERQSLLQTPPPQRAQAPGDNERAAAGIPPARQDTSAAQPTEGEFARLVKIPADCQAAREFGISGRWKYQLSFREPIQVGRQPIETPGPACLAAESCFQALKSQVAAAVQYLTRNPVVSDALSAADPRSLSALTSKLQLLFANYSGSSWGPNNRCVLVWSTVDGNWFSLENRLLPGKPYPFRDFSTAGQALLQKVRTDYAADEGEYRQLLAFNDRYTGLEHLERAQASYQQASKNDDVAAMLQERAAMLRELEQARKRKQLLLQQSARLAKYEQSLADLVTAINREDLTAFASQQNQPAIDALRSELASLSQTAPGKRGDISPKLEVFATRIGGIESAIDAARSKKTLSEQTRRMLVENEGAARRVLEVSNSDELKGAFDDKFKNSTNELIDRFKELSSSDLLVIQQRQQDIEAERRKLAVLQDQIEEAEAKYDRAKKLDSMRQVTIQKIVRALSELAQGESQGKLGSDGLAVVSSLKTYQDSLSGFDSVRFINRDDYSDKLAAADDALTKAQQYRDETSRVAQLANDLKELNNRIDRRGRRLLDGTTSSAVADITKSVSTLSSAKIPLSAEARLQLSNSRVVLNRLPDEVDNVMDREERSVLASELPSRSGAWRFSFDQDKITDEERVQAFATVESSQAKYELTVMCGKAGGELVITAFATVGTDPRRIPWTYDDPKPDRAIRLRIDSSPAFRASLELHGYANQGQVKPVNSAEFKNLLRSSRLVFADVFPKDQVEVVTAYPTQFGRLCELVAPK